MGSVPIALDTYPIVSWHSQPGQPRNSAEGGVSANKYTNTVINISNPGFGLEQAFLHKRDLKMERDPDPKSNSCPRVAPGANFCANVFPVPNP